MLTAKEARDITKNALDNPLSQYELCIENRAKQGFSSVWIDGTISDVNTRLLEERGFKVRECQSATYIQW